MGFFFSFIQPVWDILQCTSCPQISKPIYGMEFPPQNWLELHPYVGWTIVAVVAFFAVASTIATYGIWTRRHWSWKLCVGIMFVQLGLCVFSLQQGWGIVISTFIPALVILDLFRSDVRIYFHGERTQ